MHNPIDVGPRGWSTPETFGRVLEAVAADPTVDLIMIHEDIYRFVQTHTPWEAVKSINELAIEAKDSKPIIAVLPYGASDEARLEIEQMLCQSKIAVFPTFERAARALFNRKRYFLHHNP